MRRDVQEDPPHSPAPTPVLLGYADRFSVAAGETIQFMVSAETHKFSARLVRLVNAVGVGEQEEAVPSALEGSHAGRRQTIVAGSYVRVPNAAQRLNLERGLTLQAWVWPTTPARPGGQGLIACWSASERSGFVLGLDDQGRLRLDLGTASVTHAGPPLTAARWAFVAASFDPASGTVRLYEAAAEPYTSDRLLVHEARIDSRLALPAEDLLLGARALDRPAPDGRRRVLGAYNGKLDRPRLFGRVLAPEQVDAARRDASADPTDAIGAWDFAADISTTRVRDASASELHGETVNMPTRAVTDHTWSGDQVRWCDAPEQYAAIHFHDDDLADAGWQPDLSLQVPATLRSGVYALRLDAPGGSEHIPFFVRPAAGARTAPIAFLAPTLTYMAYANERMYWNPGYAEKRARVTPLTGGPPDIDQYMAEHRELGLSLYDVHSDGSGCSYSSRLRPILNMRPAYRAWRLHDAPRHFAGDLYLVGWLEQHQFEYDVITDEDLHREGAALLGRYQVVLTGSHPEYYTQAMHLAVREYLQGGGRLTYLGGNGFYWVTSLLADVPGIIELRRGISGTRAWESRPGELYQSSTGELGGIWRWRGWSPQRLVGVGFAAQGWGGAAGYRRLAASHDQRAAFIFEGIEADEVIGDFGMVLGGAAGDEIDRFDSRLGSPLHALVLATSAGQHSDYYQVTVEDVPVMVPGQGGTESPNVRADMVFFETPGGGAVFSVGSINWLGSLAWNGYANNVSRITENVVRRFLDPQPFSMPATP